jgi:hypothetical protein
MWLPEGNRLLFCRIAEDESKTLRSGTTATSVGEPLSTGLEQLEAVD